MSVPQLIIGIILLIIGICDFIGSIIIDRFSFDSCKIMKFNKYREKFERHHVLESFIESYSWASGLILGFTGVFMILDCFMPAKVSAPTAIDVYRGKTEIRITSINGVPMDTIIVWKDAILKTDNDHNQ